LPAVIEPGLTSVIVITANSGPLSGLCVDRILASSARVELILVDNASSDGQIESIETRHSSDARLRIRRNPENIGFGPACNQACALASGDMLLVLNPDCLLEVDTIERLRTAATRNQRAGILGVRILDRRGCEDKASRRREPTLRRSLCSLSGLARFGRRWPGLAGIEMPRLLQTSVPEAVDAVSGACMFIRREAFDAVGGFDEAYFLHCEDLDLCRRMRDAGFEVLYVPSIALVHEQGSSSHRRPLFVSRHKHRGMWRYFRKFDPAARNPILRALVWCGIWAHFALRVPFALLKHSRPAVVSDK
jgi:N-acetylglucosaminyl-diphospho-decaprenol L-rhamnosyltransferase